MVGFIVDSQRILMNSMRCAENFAGRSRCQASHPEAVRNYREVERRDKAELAVIRNAKH
jgi:hypothetical protein